MPSHLCLAHYGPELIEYQTGACIVRQAQEWTGPEYIHPCTVPSKPAVTPAASQVHNNVRWERAHRGTLLLHLGEDNLRSPRLPSDLRSSASVALLTGSTQTEFTCLNNSPSLLDYCAPSRRQEGRPEQT
jgi:hypothetical protein